jgi:hypothetical protein
MRFSLSAIFARRGLAPCVPSRGVDGWNYGQAAKLIPLAGIDIVGGLLQGAELALARCFLGNIGIGFIKPT